MTKKSAASGLVASATYRWRAASYERKTSYVVPTPKPSQRRWSALPSTVHTKSVCASAAQRSSAKPASSKSVPARRGRADEHARAESPPLVGAQPVRPRAVEHRLDGVRVARVRAGALERGGRDGGEQVRVVLVRVHAPRAAGRADGDARPACSAGLCSRLASPRCLHSVVPETA